jgi:hypothetical protein
MGALAALFTTLKNGEYLAFLAFLLLYMLDYQKTMRGLKTKDTAILSGYQLFHNYIRPHESLEGKAPSEACGITIEGQDKWKTLIQNASKKRA